MKKIQIIIVDDHELVANGIAKIFNDHPSIEVVSIFSQPLEALQKVPILKPDILLVDLDMPNLNGLELIQKLQEKNLATRYIILTMHLDQATIKKALEMGASGYVPKNSKESEFVICVETVAKGETFFAQKALTALASMAHTAAT